MWRWDHGMADRYIGIQGKRSERAVKEKRLGWHVRRGKGELERYLSPVSGEVSCEMSHCSIASRSNVCPSTVHTGFRITCTR